MMAAGINTEDTKKSKFIKSQKDIILKNYSSIKSFNLKFLIKWIETDNFE